MKDGGPRHREICCFSSKAKTTIRVYSDTKLHRCILVLLFRLLLVTVTYYNCCSLRATVCHKLTSAQKSPLIKKRCGEGYGRVLGTRQTSFFLFVGFLIFFEIKKRNTRIIFLALRRASGTFFVLPYFTIFESICQEILDDISRHLLFLVDPPLFYYFNLKVFCINYTLHSTLATEQRKLLKFCIFH